MFVILSTTEGQIYLTHTATTKQLTNPAMVLMENSFLLQRVSLLKKFAPILTLELYSLLNF
jgi:hypothetical protein